MTHSRIDLLRRLHTQRSWANQRVLDALRRQTPEARAIGLFAHILSAERAWLARLTRRSTEGMNMWPTMTPEECERLMRGNDAGFSSYLAALHDAELDQTVTYRNFKGIEFTTPIGDILTHVATHGVYHRGQIAQALRQAGLEPIDTDFIIFQREGH